MDFLVAAPVNAKVMEAQRTNPVGSVEPSHDAYTRLLHRLEPFSETLLLMVKSEVGLNSGVLVLDDTVLEKPYARKMDLVHRMWSGKHHAVVKGIDLLTLLWIDGERHPGLGVRRQLNKAYYIGFPQISQENQWLI